MDCNYLPPELVLKPAASGAKFCLNHFATSGDGGKSCLNPATKKSWWREYYIEIHQRKYRYCADFLPSPAAGKLFKSHRQIIMAAGMSPYIVLPGVELAINISDMWMLPWFSTASVGIFEIKFAARNLFHCNYYHKYLKHASVLGFKR